MLQQLEDMFQKLLSMSSALPVQSKPKAADALLLLLELKESLLTDEMVKVQNQKSGIATTKPKE